MSRYVFYAVFLGVVILVLGGSHYYFYLRLVRDTGLAANWARPARWLLVALAASLVLTFPLSRLFDPPLGRGLLLLPYVWMGSVFYLMVLLLGGDLARLVGWLAGKLSGGPGWWADAAGRQAFARVVALGALGLVAVIDVAAVVTALSGPRVKKVEIHLAGLAHELDGLRLVQLTDLHLGPTLGLEYLDEVVEQVRGLEPDILVLTGDAVDGFAQDRAYMLEPLRAVAPPLGKFFVTGNHEFYSDWSAWRPVVAGLGFTVLENDCRRVVADGAGLRLAGVHDFDGGRFTDAWRPALDSALARCPGNDPVVLLSHQARIIDQARAAGVGLVLSGHNHGGQIWPWSYLVLMQQPVIGGLHRFGNTWLYVSEGTGFWGPPMRLFTLSEITLVVLRSDSGGPAAPVAGGGDD